MAKKKAGGSSKLGRDSNPQYLGVKLYDGQTAKIGSIIVRQRGTKVAPGKNVKIGKDDTLYAVQPGVIKFQTKKILKFDGKKKAVKIVNVVDKKIDYNFQRK